MSDLISKILGNFGIWQLRSVLIIFLCKIPASWFMACIIFTAPAPRETEWYCSPPKQLLNDNNLTISTNEWIQIAHPKYTNKYNEIQIDHCHIYANAIDRINSSIKFKSFDINNNKNDIENDNKLINCDNFIFNSDFYSLIMQFNLVCDRDILLAWSQYWHLFGILLGSVLAIKMMLFIRPRKVMLSGMIMQIICGCLTGFLPDFNLNCLFRVNSAICCAVMFVSGQVIFQDITGGKYRIGVTTLYDTFWSIGLFLLPGLSSLFNNWSYIYIGITLPTLILIFLYPWIPDSPRWLLKNELYDDVEKLLLNSAKINDRLHTIPINLKEQLELEHNKMISQTPKPAKWLQLWNGSRAKIHLIATHLAWAIYIINFMGLLLNVRSFPNGREYLGMNTIITGISEVIGCFLAMHYSCNSKHKWLYAGVFNIIAGLIGCLGWIFPESWDDLFGMSMWMLISSIAKCGTSFALSMLAACTAELVTPDKKQIFIFSCIVWSRSWLLIAPFIGVFKRIHIALSLSAYCILSIIGGICLCVLKTPKIPSSSSPIGLSLTRQSHQNGTSNEGFRADIQDEVNQQKQQHQTDNHSLSVTTKFNSNLIEKTKF